MSNFLRAFRGELYLFTRRKSIQRLHLGVFLFSALLVVINYFNLQAFALANDSQLVELSRNNFWPQWSSALHTSLYLVELAVVLILAGMIPHEAFIGAIRDTLSRQLSRKVFILARILLSAFLPISLYFFAALGAACMSYSLFEPGDIMEDGELLLEFYADGVGKALFQSVMHGILPLVALGVIATACGVLFKRQVLAVGVCFVLVLLPTMLKSSFGELLPYYFSDFLPAFGPDSFLSRSSQFSAGFSDAYPYEYDQVARIGWWSSLPYLFSAIFISLLRFNKRAL